MEKKELLLGNEAIAGAVVAAECQVATAYPGTPSSEILTGRIWTSLSYAPEPQSKAGWHSMCFGMAEKLIRYGL